MLVHTYTHTNILLFSLSPSFPFSPLEENARVVDSLLNKLYWMNQNDQSGCVHWYITYLPVDKAQKRGTPNCCSNPYLPRSVFQRRRKRHDSSGCSFLTSPYKRHAGINTRACLKLLPLFPASYFTASKDLPVSVSPWFSRDSPLSWVLWLFVVPRLQYPRGCSHLVHCRESQPAQPGGNPPLGGKDLETEL